MFTGRRRFTAWCPIRRRRRFPPFNHLGEAWLDDPNPNPFVEFWTYSHPSVQERANFAEHYDPWANGGHGEFFANEIGQ